jgi:NADH-quinone oxidoreductase subunit G
MASCVTGCMDGMEVNSKSSDRVKEARESVTEFFVDQSLDCQFVIKRENVIYKI